MENEIAQPRKQTVYKFTKPGPGAPKGSQNNFKHGYYALKVKLQGKDLDKRTALYHALMEQENELIAALGDPSPQERILIDDTVKHMLFAASLDRYLIQLKSIVRNGRVHSGR